ncbi:uncharacterized protein LOC116214190 [Punica granatum]|uniref:Uncharacterized protein n=2 Tax=Punica granatum TaxID=22663 RepID=A0A2I0KHE8_PUNGR|nr:uncharacterized protein LOC116214190 [Punica granatum]PKI67891.1 hypothetical protein CRG98_011487 [Punica granatum]
MLLANQWKAQLSASSDYYTFEALALSRLIVVYKLTPAFCPNELEELVNSISEHGQTNEPPEVLGFSGKQPYPKVRLPCEREKKLAQSCPSVGDHLQLRHMNKRCRMA